MARLTAKALAKAKENLFSGSNKRWLGDRFAKDAKTKIKKKLPSRHVTEGPERAPHRSYLYAMGLTTEQIHQPIVGVASCWNEAAPCNIALMRQAQADRKSTRLNSSHRSLSRMPSSA